MKSRLLVSLMVIAMAAALIGGATMAWFTDSDETNPVTFSAGTLLIDMTEPQLTQAFAQKDMDILNPGDKWAWEFQVENVGTKSFKWGIYVCWNDIIGQLNESLSPEIRAMLVDKGYGDRPLSEVIEWKVFVNDVEKFAGTLPEAGPLATYIDAPFLAGDQSVTFRIEAVLPGGGDEWQPESGTTNDYQGSKMQLVFGVMAWQNSNNAPAPTLEDIVCYDFDLEFEKSTDTGHNDANKNNNRPYIDYTIDGNKITVDFINPTNHFFSWDYQVDGKPSGTDDDVTGLSIAKGPYAGEPFGQRYGIVDVGPNDDKTMTFYPKAELKIKLWRGAENDWYYEWIVFTPTED